VNKLAECEDNDDTSSPAATTEVNPAAHELLGRSEGLAMGMGAGEVGSHHVLLAYLWDPGASSDLELFGEGTRFEVLRELAALAVVMPTTPFPRVAGPRPRERVFVPQASLMRIVDELMVRLPKGSDLGFNEDDQGRAWVTANASINLESYVRDITEGKV
jgi:hypothetical protein